METHPSSVYKMYRFLIFSSFLSRLIYSKYSASKADWQCCTCSSSHGSWEGGWQIMAPGVQAADIPGQCCKTEQPHHRVDYSIYVYISNVQVIYFCFRISATRLSLLSFPVPGSMSRSTLVPMRMSVAIRGAPFACTAAWQSCIACMTWFQGPSGDSSC